MEEELNNLWEVLRESYDEEEIVKSMCLLYLADGCVLCCGVYHDNARNSIKRKGKA